VAASSREELEEDAFARLGEEADGVVARHLAGVLEAEDLLEVEARRERAVGRAGLCGVAGETFVEAGDVAREEGVRLLEAGDVGEAEFGDEARLERAPEALAAALGLR